MTDRDELLARNAWFTMDSAPRDGTPIMAIIPGHGSDNVIGWTDGLLDENEQPCGNWQFLEDQEPPDDWTDGTCWAKNEDGKPSTPPIVWRPIEAQPEPAGDVGEPERCPFCGKEPEQFIRDGKSDVWCDTENCPIEQVSMPFAAWNTRALRSRPAVPEGHVLVSRASLSDWAVRLNSGGRRLETAQDACEYVEDRLRAALRETDNEL